MKALIAAAAALLATLSFGEPVLSGTLPADNANAAPSINIASASWLVGRWSGEGLGGQIDEAWSPAAGGQMTGHFRLVRDGRPVFYEFLVLEEHAGGLRLRVKHFNPDMTGWEEKDRSVDFAFVSASPGELVFRSLRIKREGRNRITMTLRMRQPGGEVRDELLVFRRVGR